jgi:hypothetical protein
LFEFHVIKLVIHTERELQKIIKRLTTTAITKSAVREGDTDCPAELDTLKKLYSKYTMGKKMEPITMVIITDLIERSVASELKLVFL